MHCPRPSTNQELQGVKPADPGHMYKTQDQGQEQHSLTKGSQCIPASHTFGNLCTEGKDRLPGTGYPSSLGQDSQCDLTLIKTLSVFNELKNKKESLVISALALWVKVAKVPQPIACTSFGNQCTEGKNLPLEGDDACSRL